MNVSNFVYHKTGKKELSLLLFFPQFPSSEKYSPANRERLIQLHIFLPQRRGDAEGELRRSSGVIAQRGARTCKERGDTNTHKNKKCTKLSLLVKEN